MSSLPTTSSTQTARPGYTSRSFTQTLGGVFTTMPSRVRRLASSGSTISSASSEGLLQPISKITRKELARTSSCGSGGFGAVSVWMHPTKGKVALKKLTLHHNQQDEALRQSTLREGLTWQGLVHPNVLPFFGVLEGDGGLYLMSPYVKNGTLDSYLTLYPDVDRPRLMWEAAGAIAYLHERHIVHGDIKASNILVSDDVHVLLCDFGLARFEDTKTTYDLKGVGTRCFQAPELLERQQGKTYESDVWAFGMTIYQVLSGMHPFHDYGTLAMINAIANKNARPPKIPTHSTLGASYAWIWNVAEKCWQTLPADRLSMQDVHQQLRPRVTPLVGHDDVVRCLAFTLDGKTIASGADDYTIRTWDVKSGKQKGEPFKGHTDWVQCLTFSPDGSNLTSGSNDRTIRFWDAESGAATQETKLGPGHWIQSLVFSPDRKIMVSGSNERAVHLWDVRSGRGMGDALMGHGDWVQCLAVACDNKTLASGSNDHTVRLWDMESRTQIGETLIGHTDWVGCLAFSPDGKTLASGSNDSTVRLWDVESGVESEVLAGHTDWVACVAFSPDGRTLASGSNDRTIRLWDMKTRTQRGDPLIGHTEWVQCLQFSPDGKTLASGSYDNTIRLWALEED